MRLTKSNAEVRLDKAFLLKTAAGDKQCNITIVLVKYF